MLRRELLKLSGYLIVNATAAPITAEAEHKPSLPFHFGPNIYALQLPIADCAALEVQLRAIESKKARLEKNWTDVATEYRQRARTEIDRLQSELHQASNTKTRAQRRKYIQATATAAGLAIAGFGILMGGPFAIGAALGAQVVLAPANLLMQTVFDASTSEISLATVVVEDRAFLIGGVAGSSAAQPIAKILGRSLVAVQFALDAWQMSQTAQEQTRATEKALNARNVLTKVQHDMQMIDHNPRLWATLYLRNLRDTSTALKDYIEKTRATNCHMTWIERIGPSLNMP